MKWQLVAAGCLLSGAGYGAGFQLYTEGSAEALGQAAAISGRNDLTSLAWYNPSALAGAKRPAIMFGSTFVQINTDFNSDISPALDSSMSDDWRAVPHLYYVQPVSGDWTAMLSINAPYGLITEWPSTWAGSPAAIWTELATIYTTPSLAYRINEQISISAGFNVVYADAKLTAFRGPTLGKREITGDDFGFGYTASGHYQMHGDWAVGLRYQSKVKIEPEGKIKYDNDPGLGQEFDTKGYVDIPAAVNFGVANSSIENLSLGIDFVWTEWSSYDALTFVFTTNPYETSPEVVSKRWNDVWSIRVGGEYALGDNWALRAGYVWDQSPVEDATCAPELPGADRQMLMAGVGWKWNNIGIDLAYSCLWVDKAQTGAEVVAEVPTAAGEYETTTHLVSLSASYAF